MAVVSIEEIKEKTGVLLNFKYSSIWALKHPSMHGVLRLIVTLDGEDVIDCEPILGYLHRGMEKIAENRSIIQYLPYVTRWDYLATMFTEAITVNAPEFLENIQIPKRASYIRVIMLELSRIASHLLWLGPFMADLGAQTPFFYIFRERELIYDLFEAATGMRMMHNYFRIGGVAADLPYGWMDKCLDFCDYFLQGVVEYQELITQNPIFLERVEGVGFISGEEAVNWGLSGPMLRASGIQWDLRKIDPYESYNQFDWKVQWQKEGDSLARYLRKIPGGPYENLEARRFKKAKNPEWNDFEYRFLGKKPSPNFELSKQELYVRMIVFSPGDGKFKYPHRYNNVLDIYWCFFMDCDFNKKSHFLRTRKNEGLGTLKIPHELMPNSFHLLIDEINSEASRMKLRFHVRSSTSKYGFFGWNLWRQPIGFLVIKPNILVLNMVYFILFLT
ncbi:hypothetical protein ACJX0J_003208 [Zea mays]